MGNIHKRVEEMTSNATTMVGDTLRAAGKQIDSVSEKIVHKAENVVEQGQDLAAKIQHHSGEYVDKVVHYIENQPVKAVLIAAGVGLLLAKLFKRNNNH